MRPPGSRSVCRGHGPHRWHVRTPQGRRRRPGCDSIPPKGSATASDYQWITAIADRNLGGEREAVITIVDATRGDAVEVKVTQDDGTFTVKKPVLSGDLKANVASNALLAVSTTRRRAANPSRLPLRSTATTAGWRSRTTRERSKARAAARSNCRSREPPPISAW